MRILQALTFTAIAVGLCITLSGCNDDTHYVDVSFPTNTPWADTTQTSEVGDTDITVDVTTEGPVTVVVGGDQIEDNSSNELIPDGWYPPEKAEE